MTYTEKLESFYEAVRLSIIKNIRLKGSDNTIKVDDERSFNIQGGRWLEKVSEDELIDNEGYSYSYSVLSYEDLCNLADYLESL